MLFSRPSRSTVCQPTGTTSESIPTEFMTSFVGITLCCNGDRVGGGAKISEGNATAGRPVFSEATSACGGAVACGVSSGASGISGRISGNGTTRVAVGVGGKTGVVVGWYVQLVVGCGGASSDTGCKAVRVTELV